MTDRSWVNEDDLIALGLERATGLRAAEGEAESHLAQSQRILREAAPMAASTLVRLAQYGEAETVRLRAATEILNRVTAAGGGSDGREPWAEVYDKVITTEDVEKYANRGKAS